MSVSLAHRAEYALFRLAERALSGRTWEARVALGVHLGRWWHVLDARHCGIARENASRSFPDWSGAQVRDLVRANFEQLGATAAEFLGLGYYTAEDLLGRVRLEDVEHLEQARSLGKGVLFLTGHVGNWELPGSVMALRGYPLFAVVKRLANPLMDRRVNWLRERQGVRVIYHRNAVRPVFKALQQGGLVAFLMDQRASRREAVLSSFFGRPVSTNQGLALIALKTGAPVVPAFDERVAEGHVLRFGAALEPPEAGSREDRVRSFTLAFDQAIEEAVRRRPEQWFWVHRRWRIPEGLVA